MHDLYKILRNKDFFNMFVNKNDNNNNDNLIQKQNSLNENFMTKFRTSYMV